MNPAAICRSLSVDFSHFRSLPVSQVGALPPRPHATSVLTCPSLLMPLLEPMRPHGAGSSGLLPVTGATEDKKREEDPPSPGTHISQARLLAPSA